ncbi:phosphate regulon sensor histidine kinase PhoR [Agitococcus lubricus]|uniref:Phosphate regulon sensor protein PhoR n=1 Tax=Agitococcus lubricus TaxID=1077255 RepID=A0A2T5J343_9GAMM|nr:phosphate regulon sensor histidine kinase PhoR [Agitococcus lubricus]PTQ91049.1 PAS/PAC sensor signal transduction histidine kinase [Agitococcus lubricus]
MTTLLKQELLRLAYILLVFAIPGWFFHISLQLVFLGLLVYLGLHLRSLHKLHHWLKANPTEPPPELSGIWEDIADNIFRLQKEELKAKQNLLGIIARARTSVSALEEAVVLIDSQGNLEWWNSAAEKLLGFKSDIDIGKPIINLIRDPSFIRYFEHGPYTEGLRLPSWSQPNRYVQYEVTRFGQNDRLLIAYDITRLHQLEQIRKDFVANVSHELRTPLTVLSGYLETFASNEELPPKWARAFKQMEQQATRMSNLVNDLLMLSRLESDNIKQEHKAINMTHLLEQLRLDAQAYDPEKQHAILVNIDSPLRLLGTENDLRSAFLNLITNAIKYTPACGAITIRWSNDEKYGYFSVQDNGIGIEPQHIPRLTERFYRVDAARSSATGGTGLGLAIVKHVLLQHKGILNINSKPNIGSTFTCVFARESLVD